MTENELTEVIIVKNFVIVHAPEQTQSKKPRINTDESLAIKQQISWGHIGYRKSKNPTAKGRKLTRISDCHLRLFASISG